jgi:hypothetical protein
MDAPEMDDVRRVIRWILEAYSPNPAVVVDRRGDVVDTNPAALRLVGEIVVPASPALEPVINVNRLTLHPDGVRPATANWHDVAANILQRLEREQAHRPADEALSELLEEVLAYPDVAGLRRRAALPTGADLLVPLEVGIGSGETLRLVSTIGTIGAPYDVTLDELVLETFFPSDEASRSVLARWACEGTT